MSNVQVDSIQNDRMVAWMPRKPRIESSEGLYHVINRGNYRSRIFDSEGARAAFETTLFETCGRFGWRLHAYCVMSNHFHLCIGTPQGGLSEGMRWLQATFATRFNRFRKEKGHLFQGRFKSLIVEPGDHFRTLVDYIHLNPVRAGLVDAKLLAKYRWTSLWFFPKRKSRPSFLDPSWMDYSDDLSDAASGWRRYLSQAQLRETADPAKSKELDKRLCRGWCLGSADFKRSLAQDFNQRGKEILLEQDELGDFNATIWENSLESCCAQLGKQVGDAASDIKSASWKLAIASKLKRETSVTNAWLSERLAMGTPNSVSAVCGLYRREAETTCPHAKKLRKLNIGQ